MNRYPPRELQLTPTESMWDALLRFENFERYASQSAQTRDGKPAEPPPRAPLQALTA